MQLRKVITPQLARSVAMPSRALPSAAPCLKLFPALANVQPRHVKQSWQGHRTFASVHALDIDSYDEGVAFGELLECLDTQYGLAARFVEDTLSELANILGYVAVKDNTVLSYADAQILMEEIGAPPLTPEEFRHLKEPPLPLEIEQELVQMRGDFDFDVDAFVDHGKLEREVEEEVEIEGRMPVDVADQTTTSKKQKLFRRVM